MDNNRVRGTFKVIEITRWSFNKRSAQIKLEAVDSGETENNALTKEGAASISLLVTSQAVIDHFPMDRLMYVDFTPVE